MIFNLNDLTLALSHALDFMEIDFLGGVSYHSRRVAGIALRLSRILNLSDEQVFDMTALAILHDNGVGAAFQGVDGEGKTGTEGFGTLDTGPGHCLAGENHLADYPFLTDVKGALQYHHENWDGSGLFHQTGASIPLGARIIRLADLVELHVRLAEIDYGGKQDLDQWLIRMSGRIFDPDLVEAFRSLAAYPSFWLDLKNEFVTQALVQRMPRFSREMGLEEIRRVSQIFSRIIDSKSRFTRMHSQELSEKAGLMSRFYGFDEAKTSAFRIAADLHDVGKLAVRNAILDKPGKLDPPEIDVIQRHTYYTRVSLQSIGGFEQITEWASNHHEKLDGQGYPYRMGPDQLDFPSRLLGCLDIYQALTEVRPYRRALDHQTAMDIIRGLGSRLDLGIVADLDQVFGG